MERDGQPLRYEEFLRTNPCARSSDIDLAPLALESGGRVWFPVAGKQDSFATVGPPLDSPNFEETYVILAGTLKFNQGLKDERFAIGWTPEANSGPLAKAKAEFDHPPADREAKDAQRRMDRLVAEAERQAQTLEASAPSRESWWQGNLASIGAVAVAVAAFGFAAVVKWRS